MRSYLLYTFLFFTTMNSAQSIVQNVNSASINTEISNLSVGEIVVNPVNPSQSSSGIIGIVAQINGQLLEVSQFEVSQNITVYPNPTQAMLYFVTAENLANEKISIYDMSGKLVIQKSIPANHTLDFTDLKSGQYMIQFQNQKNKSFKIIKN